MVVLAILFHEALFFDKGLQSTDGIFSYLPWSSQYANSSSNPLLSDQFLRFIPMRNWLHVNVQNGVFPLWNPFINCGVPFAAAIQNAVFFPINLILAFFDPFTSAVASAFLKLLCTGFFTILFMRKLGVSFSSSLFSGIAFSLCGFMIVWLGHPHINCAMWLPLLLYFIEKNFKQKLKNTTSHFPFQYAAGFSIAYGFMLLGGHPPTMIHITIFLFVYYSFRFFTSDKNKSIVSYLLFPFFGLIVGVLIAAPQLLPYLEYYSLSSTSIASANLDRSTVHLNINTLIHYVMPYITGSPVTGFEELNSLFSIPLSNNFNERTGFSGIVTLFFALISLFFIRKKHIYFFSAMSVISLCIIYGIWPTSFFLKYIPLVNNINNMRLILVVCFSLSVLAGFGLDKIHEIRTKSTFKYFLIGLWMIILVVVFRFTSTLQPAFLLKNPNLNNFIFIQFSMFLAVMLVISLLTVFPLKYNRMFLKISAVILLCFEMLWFAMDYNPSVSRSDDFPKIDAIDYLKRDNSLFRISGINGVLPPNTGQIYGVYDVRGQDFTTVRRYEELMTGKAGNFWFNSAYSNITSRLFLCNTKYILTHKKQVLPSNNFIKIYDNEISIYRIKKFINRAVLVYEYEVIPNKASVLAKITSKEFDPEKLLILEQDPELKESSSKHLGQTSSCKVNIIEYKPDEVVIELYSPKPGFLLLLDTYYPGWKAFVDAKPAKIYRANYNFRTVAVPSGKSTVHFKYQPLSLIIGIILCIIGIMFIFFGYFYSIKLNK